MISQHLFGTRVTAIPSREGAIGFAASVGTAAMRVPISVLPIFEKISGGAVTPLSDRERGHLELAGVKLQRIDLSDADKTKIAHAALAEGKTIAEAEMIVRASSGGWQAMEKVSIETFFHPVQ